MCRYMSSIEDLRYEDSKPFGDILNSQNLTQLIAFPAHLLLIEEEDHSLLASRRVKELIVSRVREGSVLAEEPLS